VVLPTGQPPRAGFVTQKGALVLFRDGRPVVVSPPTGKQPYEALETAYGTVLLAAPGPVLVHPDGKAVPLLKETVLHARLSGDGRILAFVESHLGRHAWHVIHRVDLANLSEAVLRHEGPLPFVSSVEAHAVVLSLDDRPVRWVPGSDPVPTEPPPTQLDPLSGVMLVRRPGEPERLVQPGGASQPVVVPLYASLAPGGRRFYSFRYEPPAVTLFEVAAGTENPQVYWLPPGTRVDTAGPLAPAWEDEHHLLFVMDHPRPPLDAAALRLDVRNGALERMPLSPDAGYRPMLVRPLLQAR
jgi:hypothetical protein